MVQQIKSAMINGQIEMVEFEVDEEAIRACIPWTQGRRGKEHLAYELNEMQIHFETFFATVAEGSKLQKCSECGDYLVWRNGLECLSCGRLYNPPRRNAKLAFWGQIPSILGTLDKKGCLIRGKYFPVLEKLLSERKENAQVFASMVGEPINDEYFIFPSVTCILPDNWNQREPEIYLEDNFFHLIGIHREHVYPGGRLCIYGSWPSVNLRHTLQNRIIPRIIIDLMLSSLQHINHLRDVLYELGGISLSEVYNWIGKPGRSDRFQQAYSRYIAI